jgi:hypothetical protein
VNLQETLALIEALKASGITRFKSHEHEIELNPNSEVKVKKADAPTPEQDKAAAEGTEKLKNLINTISMSPEELANKIFPDGAL